MALLREFVLVKGDVCKAKPDAETYIVAARKAAARGAGAQSIDTAD